MAVVEACINALEHSHAADREVFVTFQVLGEAGDPEKLRIMVRDNGDRLLSGRRGGAHDRAASSSRCASAAGGSRSSAG